MKRAEKAIRAYRAASEKKKDPERKPDGAGKAAKGAEAAKTEKKEEQVAGLIRGGGATRAAKFLMLLDPQDSSKIIQHLSEPEVEIIAREIADINRIKAGEAHEILKNFHLKSTRERPVSGGPALAKEILVSSLGEEKGMKLFRKAVPIEIDNPFDFLDDLDFQQILMLLKREPSPVIASILPFLEARKASEVLEALHPESQKEVVRRVAKMQRVSPEALAKVAETLREKIRRQGRLVTEEIDGPSVLAEILNNMSVESERGILEYLDDYNPEIVEHIRDRLYSIDVIFNMADQDLQALLREFSEEEIAVILKGKEGDVRERILGNISERMKQLVAEEGERLGPMKRSDVERTTRDFVTYIRELAEEGRIVLTRNDEMREV